MHRRIKDCRWLASVYFVLCNSLSRSRNSHHSRVWVFVILIILLASYSILNRASLIVSPINSLSNSFLTKSRNSLVTLMHWNIWSPLILKHLWICLFYASYVSIGRKLKIYKITEVRISWFLVRWFTTFKNTNKNIRQTQVFGVEIGRNHRLGY